MDQQTPNPTTPTASQQPSQPPQQAPTTTTNPDPTTTQTRPTQPPPSNPTQPFAARPTAFGRSTWPSATSPRPSAAAAVGVPTQARPGMQGMGVIGSSNSIRPAGVPLPHQQRAVTPSSGALRPPVSSSATSQTPASSGFPGHGLMRLPSVGSPVTVSPNTSQGVTSSSHQPWLQPVAQGKPPLPSPTYRSITPPPSIQQRPHILQQHHQTLPTSSTQSSTQPSSVSQPQEHYGQQFPPSRFPHTPHQAQQQHQQQSARTQGAGMQRPSSLPMVNPGSNQFALQNRTMTAEKDEYSSRIISKRSIHDLVSQIDPSEKLDPEVEDILVDIAEDFVESITTFGCSLAKHRKSSTLESKDILLHLERNWNMALPGYGGDDIKSYRKPPTNDIHKERLAAIKKSIIAAETTNTKNPSGQVAGNSKNNFSKTTTSAMGT